MVRLFTIERACLIDYLLHFSKFRVIINDTCFSVLFRNLLTTHNNRTSVLGKSVLMIVILLSRDYHTSSRRTVKAMVRPLRKQAYAI